MNARTDTIQSLLNLAKALKSNPWYLTVILVVYFCGYFINSYFLDANALRFLIVPDLATGFLWVALMSMVVLASCHEFSPFSFQAAQYLLVSCMIVSGGSLGVLLLIVLINRAMAGIILEIRDYYHLDLRALPWIISIGVGAVFMIWIYRVVLIAAKNSIRNVSQLDDGQP